MEAKSFHGEDRISELPVHIIHQILCQTKINPKKAAQTCVLSKRWYDFCTSRPNLVLSQERRNLTPFSYSDMSSEEFVKLVDQSLRPHVEQNLRLEQFSLKCRDHIQELAPHIDRWIDLVVKLKIRVLEIWSFDIRSCYSLPDAIYAAKELTALKLYMCKFEFDISTARVTTFCNLKKLYLCYVHILEEQFQRLTRRCPFITILRLVDIEGINKLHVRGLVHLENLVVEACKNLESVIVQAPNLRCFVYNQEDNILPCKMEIMDAYNTLETLKFEHSNITEQQFQDIFSKHSNISELDLTCCDKLKNIEILSEKLKKLTISELRNLEKVDIQAPSLMEFEFEGHKMPFSSMDPSTLETALLFFGDLDTSSRTSLSHFVRKFNYSKGLILVIFCQKSKNILIYEDPREIAIPPSDKVDIFIRPVLHFESLITYLIIVRPMTMSVLPSTNSKVLQVLDTLILLAETKTKCFYWQRKLKEISIGTSKREMGALWYHWLKSTSLFDQVTTFTFKWKTSLV